MKESFKTIAMALGFALLAWASLGLTQDSPFCKANTKQGQKAYEELRHYLLYNYPERLVRQIDVIPRCPYCMKFVRGFAIETVYADSDRVESQSWSAVEEVRHLDMLSRGVIKRFRIRYRGDNCSCCDQPAHSIAAWVDKTSIYPPPNDLTDVPPPPPPPKIRRDPYPPPWRQAHASCQACADKADERNDIAQKFYDLQVRRADVQFDLDTARAESQRWSEYYGLVGEIPVVDSNRAWVEKAMREITDGQGAADRLAVELGQELDEIEAALAELPAELATADAALAACESSACRVPAPSASLEAAMLAEINFARTHPAEYAERLRDYRASHPPSNAADAADLDSAIAYVGRRQPMAALTLSPPLAQMAAWLAADQGAVGGGAHVGTDGSTMTQRMRAVGVWAGASAENIAFGPPEAGVMVLALVIDRGVPGYGHRTTLFDPGLQIAGVGCGPHSRYGHICVIDFAGAVVAR